MSDLVIDVEFLNAKPRWTFAAATNENEEEAGGSGIEPVEDGFLIRGTILPPHSGYVVLRARDAGVFGAVSVDGVGRFELWRAGEPFHTVNMLDYQESGCGVEDQIVEGAMGMMGGNAAMGGEESGSMPTGCPGGCDDGCTIDVMVLYTESALDYVNAQSRDIDEEIEVRIAGVNGIIAQSEIVPRHHDLLRLVYTGLLYDENGEVYDDDGIDTQQILTEVPDFENVLRLRDTMRADLLSIWVSDAVSNIRASLPRAVSLTAEKEAASVVYASTADVLTAHEFGHNLGCEHDRFNACGVCCSDLGHPCEGDCQCCDDGSCRTPCDVDCLCEPNTAYDFSVGWHFEVAGGPSEGDHYRTVMAVDVGCCGDATRIGYFSNPGVFFKSIPTGNACDDPEECCSAELAPANNALTIRGDEDHYGFRFLVAQHRTSDDTANTTTMIKGREDVPPDFEQVQFNDASQSPSISSNGRFVFFSGDSDNLPEYTFPDPPNQNVFRYDRETGLVALWSKESASENSADGDSFHPVISGNNAAVAFVSDATNLDSPPLSTFEQHIWAGPHSLSSRPKVVSRASGEQGDLGNGPSDHPAISHDGRFVAFQSLADNLTAEGGNGKSQIFLRDREEDETMCISLNFSEEIGNDDSRHPAIAYIPAENPNDDEILAAFESDADDLVQGDSGQFTDVFLHVPTDVVPTITRISLAFNGTEANGGSFAPSISADGNRIAFHSEATNLIEPDPSFTFHTGYSNVYVYDRTTEETTLVSVCPSGQESGNQMSEYPSISQDGRFVAFLSYAVNLIDDCEATESLYRQVLVRNIEDEVTYLVSVNDQGEMANKKCDHPAISNLGRFVAFTSWADNLASHPDENGHIADVFIRDRGAFLAGDLNGDGKVDDDDLAIVETNFCRESMCCECCAADLNGDGMVDEQDIAILMDNWTE